MHIGLEAPDFAGPRTSICRRVRCHLLPPAPKSPSRGVCCAAGRHDRPPGASLLPDRSPRISVAPSHRNHRAASERCERTNRLLQERQAAHSKGFPVCLSPLCGSGICRCPRKGESLGAAPLVGAMGTLSHVSRCYVKPFLSSTARYVRYLLLSICYNITEKKV